MAIEQEKQAPKVGASGVSRAIEQLNAWASAVAHLALWVLAALIAFEVVLRSAGSPTVWGAEVSVYLMLALAFLGAGHTWGEGGHFRVTALVGLFGAGSQRLLEAVCTVLALLFTMLFTWGAWKLAAFSFELNFRTPTVLQMPVGLLQGVVFLGGLFLCLALVQDLLRILRGESRPESAPLLVE